MTKNSPLMMIEFPDILTLLEQQLELHSLTTIQVSVLRATWEGKGYPQIAEQLDYDPDYLKGVGANLWQILTNKLKKRVNKRNVRYLLESYYQDFINKQKTLSLTKQDWGNAIDVSIFYNREEELKQLTQWTLVNKCRVVGILGMGGIGKTVLGIKLGKQIQSHFDYVIWRSLQHGLPYDLFLEQLTTFFSPHQSANLNPENILSHLRKHRCLIILDNLESILQNKNQGQFKQGYEDYQKLLALIATTEHQSCLIFISREKIYQTFNLVNDLSKLKSLSLQTSLDITYPFLKAQYPQTDDHLIITLSQKYDHHPLNIKLISNSIHDLFNSKIELFLQQEKTFFNHSIHQIAVECRKRLNMIEEKILFWLAINRTWTTIEKLQQDIYPPLSFFQVSENIEYLINRHLIQVKLGKYQHHPLAMEYVTEQLIEECLQEILSFPSQPIRRINDYALIKSNVEAYIQNRQRELILKPITQGIKNKLIIPEVIKQHIFNIINHCKEHKITGYAVGNLINLSQELSINLAGQNFSGLTIWHTDLPHLNLQDANFNGCHFYP